MDYKWAINKVEIAENNLIVKVNLTVTGVDGDNSASAAYIRNLTRGDSFIAYDQLTEQQVLNWCFAPEVITWVDKEDIAHTVTKFLKEEGEAQVANQIERQLAQKAIELALPWQAQEFAA